MADSDKENTLLNLLNQQEYDEFIKNRQTGEADKYLKSGLKSDKMTYDEIKHQQMLFEIQENISLA